MHFYTNEVLGQDYSNLVSFFFFSLNLSLLLLGLSFSLSAYKPDFEKTSAYECGFEPFEDARNKFDVRFYLVAILFLIFDIEVVFLYPWVMSLHLIGYLGFWSMIIFLIMLAIGFLYEILKGALDW